VSFGPTYVTATIVLLLTSLSACSGDDDSKQSANMDSDFGALALQLDLSDYAFSKIEYVITRGRSAERSGTFVVEPGQRSLRAVVGALPPYEGYLIRLMAAAQDDAGTAFTCESSGLFTIVSGMATRVSIPIKCKAGSASPSEAADGGMPAICPEIVAIRAVPSEAAVGEIAQLHADVEPSDPALYSFFWSTDIGDFTSITASRAGFRCTEPGIATIDLKLSSRNGSCDDESAFVYVTCREPDEE
jgi:hypothetical protein